MSAVSIIASAKEVLRNESEAIQRLSADLDKDLGKVFEKLIAHILKIDGRIVLTGMGKSGHIAKKIAATLASTGTPAFFVHPAEASHGDMGMITSDDMIIALSKSGNTAELSDILHFSARYALPLVAITENNESPLAKASTYTLLLPNESEACPLGAAPTTSTTLMLALGDALAITLLTARGFTAEDFNTYHPGGHLGKKLMLVRDIMHTGESIPLTSSNINMAEAMILMTQYSFGCLGVLKDNELVGLITDGDLRRNMDKDFLEKNVYDIMHTNPVTITSNTPLAAALQIMNSKKITSLFIVDDKVDDQVDGNKVRGIVHIHDCLRAGVN